MILPAKDCLARTLVLGGDLIGVVVIEAVALVAEPDAHRDRQTMALRLVEQCLQFVRPPGADRITAGPG